MEEAKLAYFELLISHAAEGTKLDSDVLDRIELLVGLKDTKAKTVRSRTDDKAASEPVNSSPPSESATGDS
jgi:hypothetical protein